jgi:hypothetical protein
MIETAVRESDDPVVVHRTASPSYSKGQNVANRCRKVALL